MAYLQKFVQDYSDSTFLSKEEEQHYAIVCNAKCEMIGDISVFFSEADNCFTLGITIAALFQKQGYAYELLKEVIAQMQNHYPSVDIVALIEKDNAKSISLFKKLNFIEECYADSIQSYVFTIYGKTD
jgi:RimJ/RimL family protein N-acetyltransferase